MSGSLAAEASQLEADLVRAIVLVILIGAILIWRRGRKNGAERGGVQLPQSLKWQLPTVNPRCALLMPKRRLLVSPAFALSLLISARGRESSAPDRA